MYLHNNLLTHIGDAFLYTTNIVFLSLQKNRLIKVDGIDHLKSLAFLDVRYNEITEFEA